MLENLDQNKKNYEEIYKLHIANSVAPAYIFDPVLPGMKFDSVKRPLRMSGAPALNISGAPKNIEDVAFYSVRQLAELVRRCVPRPRNRRPTIDPATRVFQALRIAVNDETGALTRRWRTRPRCWPTVAGWASSRSTRAKIAS